MKKLGKLQINPEKVMKNKELMTLRGGYGDVACACKIGTTVLCSTEMVENCDEGYGSCKEWCNYYCPGYAYSICVG
jgi:hypothetical protein